MKIILSNIDRFPLWNPPAWVPEQLRKEFPAEEIAHLRTKDAIPREITDATVFIGSWLRPEQFVLARKLKWVHALTAAVNQLMYPELVNSEVMVTKSAEVHGPVVAEHAVALILALSKRLHCAVRYQAQHKWSQQSIFAERPPREFSGATLGIIGLGGIGREVARLGRALRMRVVATREHPELGQEGADEIFAAAELNKLLAQSDYVVIAAPVTNKSKGLINAETLKCMKRDAYLINVSRGSLVDEAALVQTLRENMIAGAALDVFEREPLSEDSPLWELNNLIITPHTAGVTEKLWQRHYALIAENLRRFIAMQPLRGVVDKRRGY